MALECVWDVRCMEMGRRSYLGAITSKFVINGNEANCRYLSFPGLFFFFSSYSKQLIIVTVAIGIRQLMQNKQRQVCRHSLCTPAAQLSSTICFQLSRTLDFRRRLCSARTVTCLSVSCACSLLRKSICGDS